ncbi:MAG: hypothetical protein WC533_04350 [Candidatus Pacearchaeota archaeon]
MRTNKIAGYVVSLIGLAVFASSLDFINLKVVKFLPFISSINKLVLMAVGGVILIAGLYLVRNSSGRRRTAVEVPIFEGQGKRRTVVGYQRMGRR